MTVQAGQAPLFLATTVTPGRSTGGAVLLVLATVVVLDGVGAWATAGVARSVSASRLIVDRMDVSKEFCE